MRWLRPRRDLTTKLDNRNTAVLGRASMRMSLAPACHVVAVEGPGLHDVALMLQTCRVSYMSETTCLIAFLLMV